MKKKGFTLIELIAVLVILAILALIVTPLVMNIIRKARISADKRSIDAYGRSVELAIANYLLDNGSFPTNISQLTIEYTGDEVVCSITNINSDSSIYLSDCTVGGRDVEGYTYGSDKTPLAPTYTAYEVGDEVTYNNVNYYVIANSGVDESSVTLLKAEPLTVEEVNQYGTGHVNRYTMYSVGTAYNSNGYGGMTYYTSDTCGYVNNVSVYSGCTADYELSEVKYVVDAWKIAQAPEAIEARLISFEDLSANLGYNESAKQCTGVCWYNTPDDAPTWLYNSNYSYWTMSLFVDSGRNIWCVNSDGSVNDTQVLFGPKYVVRPVITLKKSALQS